MQERSGELIMSAVNQIWPMHSTSFVPAETEFDSYTLDDENYVLTGRAIAKYSYQNSETPVPSWADMYEHIMKYLNSRDKSVLSKLAYSPKGETDLSSYFSHDPHELRSPLKIDADIYSEKNTSTEMKISILRRLFNLYGADPMDLEFYLRDSR